jgi:hypothetical protein
MFHNIRKFRNVLPDFYKDRKVKHLLAPPNKPLEDEEIFNEGIDC